MACVQGIGFLLLIIAIGSVEGARWLELEPYSISSLSSDGIDHDMNHENGPIYLRTMLYGEKRCESIYGFLPCADTMAEGVFLMVLYTYLMMLGEEWIRKGGEALFVLFGDKAIGASIFRVLMAFPRIVLVIVAGVVSTESSAAQDKVAFGVSMYAGSTLITLTLIWGFCIILKSKELYVKEPMQLYENEQDSSTKCLPLKHKLSILNDNGVKIDEGTRKIVLIMLLSLVPFATVQLAALIKISPVTTSFTLMVSGLSLVLYFANQIWNPWIKRRTLAYLREENLQICFFYHLQNLVEGDLTDKHGNPNLEVFQSIFARLDKNNDDHLSHDELGGLIEEVFKLKKDHFFTEYAKSEILSQYFHKNKNGLITLLEFQEGCNKWLEKWKNVATNSNSMPENLWEKVEKVAIRNKRENLIRIETIMSRILKQVLENNEYDRKSIEGIFSQYDRDGDDKITRGELKEFIETFHFGALLDHDTVFTKLEKEFDNNANGTIEKDEFVEGFIKWINNAIKHDPSIKDLKLAIDKFEEDSWAEFEETANRVKPKASILYVIFGVGIMYLISGAFMQTILQFSNAAHIPLDYTSFFVFPIAMNTRMVITSLLNFGPSVSKNASLTFSEMYDGLVMNNLLGLLTLLITVHMKGLSWSYSSEVLTIMIPCAVVGLFALKRDAYPLWASIVAMLLYPIYVCLYYVLGS